MSCKHITLGGRDIKSELWSAIRSLTNSDYEADIQYSTIFTKEFIKEYGDWITQGKEPSISDFNKLTNDGPRFRTKDTPLTDKGIKEIEEDAKYYENKQIPLIIAPDNLRNQQTAAIIKGENPYDVAAKNILKGDVSKLNKAKILEAEKNGMYFLQMSPLMQEIDDQIEEGYKAGIYTKAQYNSYVEIHRKPHEQMILDETDGKHEYRRADIDEENTIKYTSNTTAIGGNKGDLPGGEIARERGKAADKIFQAIAAGYEWERIDKEIDTSKIFSPGVKKDVYEILQNVYNTYVETYEDGTKDIGAVQTIIPLELPGAQRYLAASADLIVFAPNGSIKYIIDLKTAKNSFKADQKSYGVGPGSWLPADTALTKNETHTLQLTNEQAMIQINHPKIAIGPDPLVIHGIIWKENPNDPDEITNVIDAGSIPKKFDQLGWTLLSQGAMVPPGPQFNIFDEPTPEQLQDALLNGSMSQENYDNYINKIKARDVTADEILKPMLELLDRIDDPRNLPELTANMAVGFKELRAQMLELQDENKKIEAIMKYIHVIQKFSNRYEDYIKSESNFKDNNYYQILQETIKLAEANLQTLPNTLRDILSPNQQGVYNALINSIKNLEKNYTLYAMKYVEQHVAKEWNLKDIKDKSGNVIKTVEQQIKDILWKPEDDITVTSLMGDAIREMAVPILGQLSLTVEKARIEATLGANKLSDDFAILGEAFEKETGLKLSDKEATDFLFQTATDGTRERFLNKIGDQYYKLKDSVDDLTYVDKVNDKGVIEHVRLQYIPDAKSDIKTTWYNKDGSTEEVSQTEFNNRLYELKKQQRAFYNPETLIGGGLDEEGNTLPTIHENGEYHSLSEEYINERAAALKFVKGEWVERKGKLKSAETEFKEWERGNEKNLTNKSELDRWNIFWAEKAQNFRDKYQTFSKYWEMQKKYDSTLKKFVPTGKVIRRGGFFPNKKYIKINENRKVLNKTTQEIEDVESMKSKEYEKLLNDNSTAGKAKLKFYNSFMGHMQDLVKKGGPECEDWFNKGGLINLPQKFFKTAAKEGVLDQLGHNLSEWFTAIPDGIEKYTDVFGIPTQKLSVPFMANVRNIQKIKDIENELRDLETNKKSGAISLQDYYKEKSNLENKLKVENHKNDAKDLEVNPIKLLTAFGIGVEKYHQLSQIEGKVLAIRDILRQKITNESGEVKQFYSKGNVGQVFKRGGSDDQLVFKRLNETNALKKVEDYVKMFYGDVYSKGTIDVIADRIMNITSFGAMGFNYLGHFKNAVLYQASNFRQNIAERFVTRRNYTAAQAEFFKDFLPGMQTKLFDKKSGPFKAKSKMEWMMHHFGLDVDAQLKAQGKASQKWLSRFYMGEEFAIHWAQYTMQSAYMRDQVLLDKNDNPIKDKNGNSISMYDAYQWNPNTGVCELIPDAKETLEQQKNIIITAKDIQTRTQGNFDELNKPLIKNYLLGRMVSQFHNYFKTAWNDRFDKAYTHTTLGEIEGTWTSVVSYCKMLKEFEGHWYDKLKNGWKSLSEHQQKNLKTDAAELLMVGSFFLLSYLIKQAAKGVSGTQDPNRKKFLNMLSWTSSAIAKEQGTLDPVAGIFTLEDFTKDPMAISPVLKGLTQALLATGEFPFQIDTERYYQRGVFKGNSKAAEDWKKILPILKQLHRWSNFLDQGEFEPGQVR